MSTYTSTSYHEGGMRYRTEFSQSNVCITTDISAALGGRGESPSPAQLLAASVASCMGSMMVFLGARRGINTEGITIESGYEEGKNGITALNFHITVPQPLTKEEQTILEAAVKGCPVGAVITPGVTKNISWTWAS